MLFDDYWNKNQVALSVKKLSYNCPKTGYLFIYAIILKKAP